MSVCVLHSDFGLGCQLTAERRYRVSGQAGTKGYQAPEVLQNAHYGCEVDVFSYGIVIYELVHNQRPWRSGIGNGGGGGDNDEENAADILARFKDLPLSSKLSPALASFLRAVLTPDWRQRIGCAPKKVAADGSYSSADQRVDWGQMKSHEFFAGIDWDMLYAKKVPPPFVPDNSRANCSPKPTSPTSSSTTSPGKSRRNNRKTLKGGRSTPIWERYPSLPPTPQPAAVVQTHRPQLQAALAHPVPMAWQRRRRLATTRSNRRVLPLLLLLPRRPVRQQQQGVTAPVRQHREEEDATVAARRRW
jgi:serine/threonine protein kinase